MLHTSQTGITDKHRSRETSLLSLLGTQTSKCDPWNATLSSCDLGNPGIPAYYSHLFTTFEGRNPSCDIVTTVDPYVYII